MERLPTILQSIAASESLEGDFLDFLSQLEYVGCRKILKGVPFHAITLEVLRHVAEEASHAYLLKAAADRLGKTGSWADSALGAVGWEYFRRLDERVSAEAEVADLSYPAVSWAIERRVMKVYPLYLEITRDEGVRHALRRILAQEKRHGREFEEIPFPMHLKEKMIGIEAELWEDLIQQLGKLIENNNPNGTTAELPRLGPETRGLTLQ